jgi:ABC-type transport system substrate-binding protein
VVIRSRFGFQTKAQTWVVARLRRNLLFKTSKMKLVIGLLIGAAMAALIACGGTETITVVETVVVTEKGDTVVETVVVTEKGDTVTVVATATPEPAAPAAVPEDLITAPDTSTPAGTAVIAINSSDMGAQNGLNQAGSGDGLKNVGIAETLFRRAADDSTLNWIANDFTISSDLSSATVKIEQGIPFQVVDGYDAGDLTAHDVAFSMNDANSATTPESIHGQAGDFAGLWGEWVAVDDETIEFDFTSYDSTWKDDFVNQSGQALSILSKNAFDDKGIDWVRDNVVATGPYQIEEWLRDESYTIVNREGTHWKSELEPKTDRVQILQVTEATTRASLLRTGQVDIAHLEPKDAAKFDLTEFTQTSAGGAVQLGVFFAGNLWEDTYGGGDLKGQPLPPKATFVHDLPWIGKPGSSHGANDLDQAKTVRRALALAIDRDLVNDTLLAGLGAPVYVEYFNAASPNWDSKYEYAYDPDESIRLIQSVDNDYQHGSAKKDGPLGDYAFEVSVYAGPELGGGASVTGEIADAVAGFWADIGLQTFSLKFSYQTFRPTVVGRANTHPWITSCDKGKASNPWHFPKGLVQTSLTRGGFSCGFESPVILDLYQQMAQAPDTATATEAANEYLEYVYDQTLQPGVVAVPDAFYFNNNKVKSYDMDIAAASNLNSTWKIELK